LSTHSAHTVISMTPPPLRSTLFPYTTLFRSWCDAAGVSATHAHHHKGVRVRDERRRQTAGDGIALVGPGRRIVADRARPMQFRPDRKSTRLNSSHVSISYAVFFLKKKKRN